MSAVTEKRKELWFAFWRRYVKLINCNVKIVEPNNNDEVYRAKFISDNTTHIIQLTSNNYNCYTGYICIIEYNPFLRQILSVRKNDSETIMVYKNLKDIKIQDEHIESILNLIQLFKSSVEKLDDICRYIHAFETMMNKTDYIKYISSARMFMLCSKKTFPRDISKIIYKKILFFLFYFSRCKLIRKKK